MQYLLLQNPGHNWVYYNSSDKLAIAELKIALQNFNGRNPEPVITTIENIRYIAFETEEELSMQELTILSQLSFVFAIYLLMDHDGKKLLQPVAKKQYEYLDNKISSILKYPGKTNELFTRMMIQVAIHSSEFSFDDPITLLDPVAGRGTTLFEGAVHGFRSYGIEIEPRSVHDAKIFFRKFLQEERIKHTLEKRRICGKNKKEEVLIEEFAYATHKEDFKDPDKVKKLGLIEGDTTRAAAYFKPGKFHLIVGDLPYGIFHGNHSAKNTGTSTRNPSEMLKECIPAWSKVLKKGGVMVLAWNSFLISPKKMASLFESAELQVLSEEPYHDFEHMVDKSIKRDIIVVKKLP